MTCMALGNSQPNINSFFNEKFLYPHSKQIKADDARHSWLLESGVPSENFNFFLGMARYSPRTEKKSKAYGLGNGSQQRDRR